MDRVMAPSGDKATSRSPPLYFSALVSRLPSTRDRAARFRLRATRCAGRETRGIIPASTNAP